MVANLTLDTLQSAGAVARRDPDRPGPVEPRGHDGRATPPRRAARVTPDAQPQRGLFYRADHFPLAKRGVPVLLLMALGGGVDLVDGGREAGDRWVSEFTARCYHQTCDEWRPDWDLRGAAQDVASPIASAASSPTAATGRNGARARNSARSGSDRRPAAASSDASHIPLARPARMMDDMLYHGRGGVA